MARADFPMTLPNTRGSPGGSVIKSPLAMQETQVQPLGQKNPLEEGMATLWFSNDPTKYYKQNSH